MWGFTLWSQWPNKELFSDCQKWLQSGCLIIIIIIMKTTECIRLGWHKTKLWGHLTNVIAKVNENSHSQIALSHGYVATSGKLHEKSSVSSQLDDRTSGDSVPDLCNDNRESAVYRFHVGTANVSDDQTQKSSSMKAMSPNLVCIPLTRSIRVSAKWSLLIWALVTRWQSSAR